MEFGLSQDQLLLDDSVRKFLASEVPLDKVRQLAAGEVNDASFWQGLADMGLAGLIIPEAHGGADLGSKILLSSFSNLFIASPTPRQEQPNHSKYWPPRINRGKEGTPPSKQ